MGGKRGLILKLGFACNNNCLVCSQAHNKGIREMNLTEIEKYLEQGIESGAGSLVLTGGEPTIRHDLVEIVGTAKRLGYREITLQTNGRMLCYKDYCKRLAEAGVTSTMIGFHGARAETHDYISQFKGAFDQAIEGIKNTRELGGSVTVNYIINKINYKETPKAAQVFIDLDIRKLLLSFVSCNGNVLRNADKIYPTMSEVKSYMHKSLDIAIASSLTVRVCAYPFCFLSGYEKYCEELYAPVRDVRDAQSVEMDFDDKSRAWSRCKGPQCKECRFEPVCGGPEIEYTKRFGWSEFKPVEGKKARSAEEIVKGEF